MASITPTRLTGFSGSLDTESIIKKLMSTERMPLDNILKKKQLNVWKREDYLSMNTKLLSFRNTVNDLRFEKNFEKTTASSSNTSVLDVTSAGTIAATTSVEVKSLASSAMLVGKTTVSPTATLTTGGTFNIKGSKGNVDITYTAGQSTLETVVKDINSNSAKTGVRASLDTNNGSIYLTAMESGSTSLVEMTGDVGILGLTSTSKKGADAEYLVNGVSLTSSTNSVTINGTQVALKGSGTATIGSVTDRSGVVDKIKAFVEQYNELIDTFSTATTTRKNRDYAPLTDEQKESMSEKQIEQWEMKARQGTLYNDSILKDTLSAMRTGMSKPLNVPKDQVSLLSQIGITVMSSYKENGKLEIDEEKLTEAVNSNFDQVKQLFLMDNSSAAEVPGKSNIGLADRLYNTINTQLDAMKKKIGSTGLAEAQDDSIMGKELKELSTQESDWKAKLIDIENRYYKQFSAMEQALQKLNSKSSIFSSM
ncbi:flagellar hook protein [Paenibacillus sp. CAA11]|uniref:flagellar filament capping protein FliD n=1 Tax=Paenibacillus sp. CAA11 TaxID=1532905 RepID=UPI000D36657E|nr:flagellar filament capping protein FliD [Paenibacillus sp. CAA11]AWB46230.1 flagellar hook protein [Paenibacillus sp. CAA11]